LSGILYQWQDAVQQRSIAFGALADKEEQRRRAVAARDQAETHSYFSRIAQAHLEWRLNHDMVATARLLERCRPENGQTDRRGWEWHQLRGLLHTDLLTLVGHSDGVVSQVAFSPNGRLIASSGGGNLYHGNQGPGSIRPGQVIVWDAVTGQNLRVLSGHQHMVPGVAFSPDGTLLASASKDTSLRIWEVASGRELHRLTSGVELLSVAFSPDGKQVAVGGQDHTVTLWDAATGQQGRTLHGHSHAVISLAFSPDGRSLVSGTFLDAATGQGEMFVWDMLTGEPRFKVRDWPRHVEGVAFSPDSRLIAAASGSLRVWEASTGQLLRTIASTGGDFLGVAFSPDGSQLASAGSDHTVRLWDLESGKEEAIWRGHAGRVRSLSFHPSGRFLASGEDSGEIGDIKIWDLTRHPEHQIVYPTRQPVETLAFTPEGNQLAVVAQSGDSKVIDIDTAAIQSELALEMSKDWLTPARLAGFDGAIRRLAALAPGRRLVNVWDVATVNGRPTLVLRHELGKASSGHELPVYQVVISRDGRRVASAALGERAGAGCREIKVWDADSGRALLEFSVPTVPLRRLFGGLALSADGRQLAFDESLPGNPPIVKVCAVDAGDPGLAQPLQELSGPDALIAALAFSPDGSLLAAADLHAQVRICDIATGKMLYREPLAGSIHQLAFSPDCTRLAGVNREELKLWDVGSGAEVLILRGARPRPSDGGYNPQLAWNSDGTRLASSNWDGTLSIWDTADRESPAARAHRRQQAESRAFAWHARRALRCRKQPASFAFQFHWKQLALARASGPYAQRQRGELHALLGHWQSAAVDYAEALEAIPPAEASHWLSAAALQLLAGDQHRYRQIHEHALQHLAHCRDPQAASVVLRLLALSDQVPLNAADLDRLAQPLRGNRLVEPWYIHHALGLAHYRAGNFQQAIDSCEQSLRDSGASNRHQVNWPVLALAHHRLGQADVARQWFDRTDAWLRRATKEQPACLHLALDDHLADGLELLVLNQEAKRVFESRSIGSKKSAEK
jgi:WD40 repeat protein